MITFAKNHGFRSRSWNTTGSPKMRPVAHIQAALIILQELEVRGFGEFTENGTIQAWTKVLWMDEILDHSETMKNHCLLVKPLVVAGEPLFHGFVGGAKWNSSVHSRSHNLNVFKAALSDTRCGHVSMPQWT